MLPIGNHKVKIIKTEMEQLNPPEDNPADIHRYFFIITGEMEGGEQVEGKLFMSNSIGKDKKSCADRSLETLREIGLPNGDLTRCQELVGKHARFKIEEKEHYKNAGEMVREVTFVNPCRESLSQDTMRNLNNIFGGGGMQQQVNTGQPQQNMQQNQQPANNGQQQQNNGQQFQPNNGQQQNQQPNNGQTVQHQPQQNQQQANTNGFPPAQNQQ